MIFTPEQYGAVGNGVTDDGPAIRACLAAAAAAGGSGVVAFGPKTYLVAQDGSNAWCITLPGSNLELSGVRGMTSLRQPNNVVTTGSACILLIDTCANIYIHGITFDGNWGNALTAVTAASDNQTLPQATINVTSTTGFPSSGTMTVVTELGPQIITYTGTSSTTFTGCTGGTTTMLAGNVVGYADSQSGLHQTTQGSPSNHGIMARGTAFLTIDDCQFTQCYGDAIWIGASATSGATATDTIVTNSNANLCARNGVTLGQSVERVAVTSCTLTNCFQNAWDTEAALGYYFYGVVVAKCLLGIWWNPGSASRNTNFSMTIEAGPGLSAEAAANYAQGFRVQDCTFLGCLFVEGAVDLVVKSNRFLLDWAGNSGGAISIQALSDDIVIEDNYVYQRTLGSGGGTGGACIGVAFSGTYYNYAPLGVIVRNNAVHARNGRLGILVYATGGGYGTTGGVIQGITGTASAVSSTSMTDSTATWIANQWAGYNVRIGAAIATVTSNTTMGVLSFNQWTTELGRNCVVPSAGAYEIASLGGVVDVVENRIDCTNGGGGHGGYGIWLQSFYSGMRARVWRNTIKNASPDAIRVTPTNTIYSLDISENHAWDCQPTPTCLNMVNFDGGYTNIPQLTLRGNTVGDGIATAVAGVTPAVGSYWLESNGIAQTYAGYGQPDNVVTAPVGSLYRRLEGGTSRTLWVKEKNSGSNTGWNPVGQPPQPKGWTIDEGSGIGCPANTTEWQALIAAAGLTGTVPVPSALWLCQETSGNLADSIGTFTMTASGTVTYSQTVLGWARRGVQTPDGTASAFANSAAGVPDLSTLSCSMFSFAVIDTDTSAARSILAMGTGGTTAAIGYVGGGSATLATSGANFVAASGSQYTVVHPYGVVSDRAGSRARGFDDSNKLSPTFATTVTGKLLTIGGIGGLVAAPGSRTMYAWSWFTPPSDANIKLIMQTMGWTIGWT